MEVRVWSYVETWALIALCLALVVDLCIITTARSQVRNTAIVAFVATAAVIVLLCVGINRQLREAQAYKRAVRKRALRRVARYAARHGARFRPT